MEIVIKLLLTFEMDKINCPVKGYKRMVTSNIIHRGKNNLKTHVTV